MPDREHTFKGVHDKDTFRQGIALEAVSGRSDKGVVSVRARLRNVGAGHYLPTTPTPAAWIRVELLDEAARPIEGASVERRIGRHLEYRGGWKEVEDSRIPPGEALEVAGAWQDGRVKEATTVRIEVRVEPDENYERFYRRMLKGKMPLEEQRLLEQALRDTQASHYLALRRDLLIGESAP